MMQGTETMPQLDRTALTAALDALPKRFAGPGGVAGVMLDGKVIAKRAWGYANLDTGAVLTTGTRLPLCSISKQFTCQVLLATLGEPEAFDHRVADYLPRFTGPLPSLRQLCHNQSGLRDYWALTVLQGAFAEHPFRREDALPLIARMKTGHFPPGSGYSYCNCNFRIVAEIIESETGQPLDALYARHIFGPAGMKTATLTADTRHPEDGVVGYEGTDATGYFPAENGIYWIGDAGISASLDDMLAYEGWIDATRDDAGSLYRRASVPPAFADGSPAFYGYGLAHHTIAGLPFVGHGGALRGFRAHRLNCREARLSVIVLFNHEASAHAAAQSLIEAALGQADPAPAPLPDGWNGQWIGPNGLLARIESGRNAATLRYATGADTVTLAADGTLGGPRLTLRRDGDDLLMQRAFENFSARFTPLPQIDSADGTALAGTWTSPELDARMTIEARDGGTFARFTGLLGTGRMERMAPVGPDVWIVATRRSMDAPAPGDWTLIVRRDASGKVEGLTLGCWLAREITYHRA